MKTKLVPYIVLCVFSFCMLISCVEKSKYPGTDKEKIKFIDSLQEVSRADFYNNRIQKFISDYFDHTKLVESLQKEHPYKLYFYKGKGDFFYRAGLYKEANKNYKKGLKYLDKAPKKQFTPQVSFIGYLLINDIANNYKKLNLPDSTTQYLQYTFTYLQWDKVSFKDDQNKMLIVSSSLNNYGIHLMEDRKDYEKALEYFKKSDSILKRDLADTVLGFKGSVRDNIALVYAAIGEFEKAKKLFEENFAFYNPKVFPDDIPAYERWTRAGIQIIEADVQLKKFAHAEKISREVESIFDTINFPEKLKTQLRFLRAKEELFLMKDDFEKAFSFRDQANEVRDSINTLATYKDNVWNNSFKRIAAEQLTLSIQEEEAKNALLHDRRMRRLQLLVVGLLLIFGVTWLLIKTYRKKYLIAQKNREIIKKRKEVSDLKNRALQKKIEVKKKDLSDYTIHVYQNREWNKEFVSKVQKTKEKVGRARIKAIEELEKEVNHKILLDQKTREFYDKIDKLSNAFYQKLYEQFPELTKSEIKLCTMIRLGFNNAKIATLQSIHLNSVHQSRYKLKRKLELKSNQDLNTFINAL